MSTLNIISGGATYDLSDVLDYAHIGDDGWGMSPVHRLQQKSPMQDGVTDVGFRLDPRILNLKIMAITTGDLTNYFALRARLLEIFKPSDTPVKVQYVLPNGDLRQVDCFYLDGLTFPARGGEQMSQNSVIQLQAPDPVIYDPVQVFKSFGAGGGAGFVVPTLFNTTLGASTLDETQIFDYSGDGRWQTFPVIQVVGPITNFLISQQSTGEKLQAQTGLTVAGGDTYTIDCTFSGKTVTNAAGADKINDLTDDSDVATFHIAASPEAAGGLNQIRCTGTGISSATRVYFRYYPRFIGL